MMACTQNPAETTTVMSRELREALAAERLEWLIRRRHTDALRRLTAGRPVHATRAQRFDASLLVARALREEGVPVPGFEGREVEFVSWLASTLPALPGELFLRDDLAPSPMEESPELPFGTNLLGCLEIEDPIEGTLLDDIEAMYDEGEPFEAIEARLVTQLRTPRSREAVRHALAR